MECVCGVSENNLTISPSVNAFVIAARDIP